jgi:hypothetical protein
MDGNRFSTEGLNTDGFDRVSLTAARNGLALMIDGCQRQPIILQSHARSRAALVSIDFLQTAIEAITQQTAPIAVMAQDIPYDIQKDIVASYPSDAEIAIGGWNHHQRPLAISGTG